MHRPRLESDRVEKMGHQYTHPRLLSSRRFIIQALERAVSLCSRRALCDGAPPCRSFALTRRRKAEPQQRANPGRRRQHSDSGIVNERRQASSDAPAGTIATRKELSKRMGLQPKDLSQATS